MKPCCAPPCKIHRSPHLLAYIHTGNRRKAASQSSCTVNDTNKVISIASTPGLAPHADSAPPLSMAAWPLIHLANNGMPGAALHAGPGVYAVYSGSSSGGSPDDPGPASLQYIGLSRQVAGSLRAHAEHLPALAAWARVRPIMGGGKAEMQVEEGAGLPVGEGADR